MCAGLLSTMLSRGKWLSFLIVLICLVLNVVSTDVDLWWSRSKASGYSRQGLSLFRRDANQSDLPSYAKAKPARKRALTELPTNFDWSDLNGINYLAPSWNQHIPTYCGSCYLHATLAAAQDRIKIAKGAKGPDVMLARQTLLNCIADKSGIHNGGDSDGCNGGSSLDVYRYMHDIGLPDETCSQYVAATDDTCNAKAVCMNCMPQKHGNTCWAVKNFTSFRVQEFGLLPMDQETIMSEVLDGGPVACSLATTDEFDYEYIGGIWKKNSTADEESNHIVEITGWGVTRDGTKFWQARNSWGTYWGERGFFKILRGENLMRIEEDCWFVRVDWSEEKSVLDGEMIGGMYGLRGKPQEAKVVDVNFRKDLQNNADLSDTIDGERTGLHAGSQLFVGGLFGSALTFIAGGAIGLLASNLFRKRDPAFLPIE